MNKYGVFGFRVLGGREGSLVLGFEVRREGVLVFLVG